MLESEGRGLFDANEMVTITPQENNLKERVISLSNICMNRWVMDIYSTVQQMWMGLDG